MVLVRVGTDTLVRESVPRITTLKRTVVGQGNIKGKSKGRGQECPRHTDHFKIKRASGFLRIQDARAALPQNCSNRR